LDGAKNLSINVSQDASAGEGENAGIVLYRIDNSRYWKDYSVESLFVFDNTPAALLYRDDYFIDNSIPPPVSRVWGLTPRTRSIMEVPAFEELPPEDGWDLEDLVQGPDERWYYRAVKKSGTSRGVGYFRTGDLLAAGEQSSPGAMQSASQPRPTDQAPVLLRLVLEAAFSPGQPAGIARVISPEFPSFRYFASPAVMNNNREDLQIYPGYYQPDRESGETAALVISPAGRGFMGTAPGGYFEITEITLPPLPEGFVYTGAGVFPAAKNPPSDGSPMAILASWEEQDGWNVGAAGFVLVGQD
jgi:hypothetical protein